MIHWKNIYLWYNYINFIADHGETPEDYHGGCEHYSIEIIDNIFDGPSGRWPKSRGYIIFRPSVHNVKITGNTFLAPDEAYSQNIGIVFENPDKTALKAENNLFMGNIIKEFTNEA